MEPNQPVFESFKESVHKQYGRDETEGSPKTVFLWKVFQGKEDVLNAAIAEGSVTEWQQDGITFCAFRKMNAGVEKNWSQTTQLKASPQKLQDDQFQNLSKACSSLCWQFGSDGEEENTMEGGQASSSGKQHKALECAGLTAQMTTLVKDAEEAMQRLQQSSMKLIGKCKEEKAKIQFKATVLEIKGWINKNEHILTWKDYIYQDTSKDVCQEIKHQCSVTWS